MKDLWKQLKFNIFLAGLVFVLFGVSLDSFAKFKDNVKSNSTKVTLLLDWKPNTNHTGFFVAKNKGFFQDAGLDVTILNPSQTSATTLVGTGKSHFGISYATNLIHAREARIALVAIASLVQPDSSCFVWRKSTGIQSVKDFEGKRFASLGSFEEAATLKFIMEKNGADFSKLKILTVGISDFLQTTEKNADIMWEYKAWGMLSTTMHGIEIGSYCPGDHFKEMQKPSPLLVTNEDFLKKNPDIVKRFINASEKGFNFAIENPEEAAKILAAEVPGLDEKFLIASQKILSPMYKANAPYWGYITPEQFESYTGWMIEQKLIVKKPQLSDFVVSFQNYNVNSSPK